MAPSDNRGNILPTSIFGQYTYDPTGLISSPDHRNTLPEAPMAGRCLAQYMRPRIDTTPRSVIHIKAYSSPRHEPPLPRRIWRLLTPSTPFPTPPAPVADACATLPGWTGKSARVLHHQRLRNRNQRSPHAEFATPHHERRASPTSAQPHDPTQPDLGAEGDPHAALGGRSPHVRPITREPNHVRATWDQRTLPLSHHPAQLSMSLSHTPSQDHNMRATCSRVRHG